MIRLEYLIIDSWTEPKALYTIANIKESRVQFRFAMVSSLTSQRRLDAPGDKLSLGYRRKCCG